MRKIRDVLRCLYDEELSVRETARLTGIGRTTVTDYKNRFTHSSLTWPLGIELDDHALEQKLYHLDHKILVQRRHHVDFSAVYIEMKKKGATLGVLYEEWVEAQGERRLSYSRFCTRYNEFKQSLKISLRQTYLNGEIGFVDYAGHTMSITDVQTGIEKAAQIFLGVLGGSSYTFCEATWSQKSRDWIESHIRMFEYFGGVPRVVVHDNLRSAVTKADRLMPVINESYLNLCRHYRTHPFAARAYRPKDKSRAEVAVQIAERWILFRLRNRKFFSLVELNQAIRELLDQLNKKAFQKLPGSRFSNWLESERAALLPVRVDRYEFAEWGKVRAGIDYHVIVDDHAYSVPNHLRGKEFEYRLTTIALDLFLGGKCITSHTRSFEKGKQTTHPSHRTDAHNAIAGWTTAASLDWARAIGQGTEALLTIQLEKLNNHLFGYRLVQAMKKLHKAFGKTRFEQACRYAFEHKVTGTNDLRRILVGKLDQLLAMDPATRQSEPMTSDADMHENIRGAMYYTKILATDESKQS